MAAWKYGVMVYITAKIPPSGMTHILELRDTMVDCVVLVVALPIAVMGTVLFCGLLFEAKGKW